jgi:hypothetical protein
MKVFRYDCGGCPLIAPLDGMLETLRSEMDAMGRGDTFTIEAIEMSQGDIDALPEWDGP